MFRFAHPEYLQLLWIILILHFVFFSFILYKKNKIKEIGNPEILKQLMPDVSAVSPYLKFYLSIFVITLIIFVLARPQFGSKLQKVKNKGVEVMIALDISNSMLAEDIYPNRLEKSKQLISKIVDEMKNDRVGLIVFAGDAFVQLPITSDFVSAKMFLSSITPDLISNQGTAIGSAIELASNAFSNTEGIGRAIILITDGEDHQDDAIKAVKDAQEKRHKVHVIGIGSVAGVPIPIKGTNNFIRDKDGNIVVSRLNEQMCQNIAKAGNGIYVRADNTNAAFSFIKKELEKMTTIEIESKTYSEYDEQYQSLAWIALFLLIVEFFILEKKNKLLKKIFTFTNKK